MKRIYTHISLVSMFFLFLVTVVFFRDVVFQNKMPVPSDTLVGLYYPWRDYYSGQYPRGIPFKNFLITDPIRQQIPWRKLVIDEWKQGSLPTWNPYAFSGTPLLGNIQAGAFYPFNILFLFFSFPVAWSLLIMMQPLLGGVFLFFFLRNLRLHPVACLIGALAWSFSGFSIAWMTWGTIVHTAVWLPLLLLSTDKILEHSRKNQMLWLGMWIAGVASSFFAGHVQVFLYCFCLWIAYAIYRFRSTSAKKSHGKNSILLFFAGIAIVSVVTFPQWKSLLTTLTFSSRVVEENLMTKEGWFLPWQHMVQFLVPDFFGNPATLNYWGTWNYGELVGYIGVLPLLFAVFAIIYRKAIGQRFWMGVLGGALLFALPTPWASLPYLLHIPVLSSLQPTRLMVLIVFALSVLAAYGFNVFIKEFKNKRILFVFGGVGLVYVIVFLVILLIPRFGVSDTLMSELLVSKRNIIFPFFVFVASSVFCFFLTFNATRKFAYVLILFLVSIDLLRFGQKFTPFTDQQYFYPETNIISYLEDQPKPFRVLTANDKILPPNTASYYGIEVVSGYDPLYSKYYEGFIAAANRGNANLDKPYGFNRIIVPTFSDSPLLSLMDISYIVTLGEVNRPDLEFIMGEGSTYLYKVVAQLPRAHFVNGIVSAASFEQSIQMLYEPGFPVRHRAVVLGDVSIQEQPVTDQDIVTITSYQPSTIHLAVNATVTRFLVMSNSYFPGWHATIDGEQTKIYQTNGTFQGIFVPEGSHRVTFTYGI